MLSILFFFSWIFLITGQDVVDVTTQHGTIRGQVIETPFATQLDQFLGIPYALPPFGSRRFGNPEVYGDYPGGLLEASEYGPQCHQIGASPDVPTSEDCLYLNVWRPRPAQENKAVMVWIHGGGFMVGSGDYNETVEHTLAAYGDIILVTINYRLGALGFFYTGDDRMENGNFGLLDQQLALSWVQENIRDFGGDPKQVTIFGGSAGSTSVSHHLTIEGADGLFNRVIMQSGTSNAFWTTVTPEETALATQLTSDFLNCPNDDTILDCLREVPANQLAILTAIASFNPAIDGTTIVEDPLKLVISGEFRRKDSLLGFNKNEGPSFLGVANITEEAIEDDPYGSFVKTATYLGQAWNLTEDQVNEVIALYEPDNITDPTEAKVAISDMVGDLMFLCPAEEFARETNRQGVTVYQYYLTYRASTSTNQDWWGVAHGDELQWMFGSPFSRPEIPYNDLEDYFSAEIMDMWINFAKYGSINDDWLPYTSDGASYAEFAGPGDFRYFSGQAVGTEKCSAWQFSYD